MTTNNIRPRCLNCKTSLTEKIHSNYKSYVCQNCHSGLIPIFFISKIISEYEFNKLKYEIHRAQILSSTNCALCNKQMVKIVDFLKSNQIEACNSCQVTWMNPKTWEKIKKDQINYRQSIGKIKLNSNDDSDYPLDEPFSDWAYFPDED